MNKLIITALLIYSAGILSSSIAWVAYYDHKIDELQKHTIEFKENFEELLISNYELGWTNGIKIIKKYPDISEKKTKTTFR